MKKFISSVLAITTIFASTLPLSTFAKGHNVKSQIITIEQEIAGDDTSSAKSFKQSKRSSNKGQKSSLFSRLFDKCTGAFWQTQKNILYYSLISITVILLLDKVKFLNKEDIFDKIRNIKFGDVEELFSSIYSNISSIPGALNLIYTTYKQKNPSADKDPDLTCKDNFVERSAKQISTLIDTFTGSNKEISNSQKISDTLRNLSDAQDASKGIWHYLKTNGTTMWLGSMIGSAIGAFGTLFGVSNLGWIYGALMLPYLFSFRTDVKDLDVLANSVDLCNSVYNKTSNTASELIQLMKNQISKLASLAK